MDKAPREIQQLAESLQEFLNKFNTTVDGKYECHIVTSEERHLIQKDK